MRPKKTPESSPDLQIQYKADGSKILPIVNGKPIYPEACEKAGIFASVLKLLATFDPEIFSGEKDSDAITAVIHLARHYCDVNGLEYQEIDRMAHIEYSTDQWDSQVKHLGDKK